jgi:hypothetical protein
MALHHISKLIGSAKDLVVHPDIQFHFLIINLMILSKQEKLR